MTPEMKKVRTPDQIQEDIRSNERTIAQLQLAIEADEKQATEQQNIAADYMGRVSASYKAGRIPVAVNSNVINNLQQNYMQFGQLLERIDLNKRTINRLEMENSLLEQELSEIAQEVASNLVSGDPER